jgi:nitrogen fixation NifU-like protein
MDTDPLYQEKILALARMARTGVPLERPQFSGVVNNPTCGDRVRIDITLDSSGYVQKIGAKVEGCALCEAGAGFLLDLAPGRHRNDFADIHDRIAAWLKGGSDAMVAGQQAAFIPVRDFAARHKCVTLPFSAAADALKDA